MLQQLFIVTHSNSCCQTVNPY